MTLLTKSANVENLLGLDHREHSILSWTVNPPEITEALECNTVPVADRIAAMRRCAEDGYPVRAVIMPIIPLVGWKETYRSFLHCLLEEVPLSRITLGSICSYPQAVRLMERKLGGDNPITAKLDDSRRKGVDGRARFPYEIRKESYRVLVQTIRRRCPKVEIGLCLEEPGMFEDLGIQSSVGLCNCVL